MEQQLNERPNEQPNEPMNEQPNDDRPAEVVRTVPVATGLSVAIFSAEGAPFWSTKFETQMKIHRINEEEWRDYLICALQEKDIQRIDFDIVEPESRAEAYKWLKNRLLELHGISRADRVKGLLSRQMIGDRLPNEFLRQLRRDLPRDVSEENGGWNYLRPPERS